MISIITANYNYGRYLDACIQSVLGQTYTDWELYVCDDGSTDNSEDVVWKYNDSRIHFLKGAHAGGPAVPRNRGIRASSGQYVAFLDADDMLTRDSLEKRLKAMEQHGLDLVCGQTLNVDPTVSPKLARWLVPHVTTFSFCRMPTILMTRALLGRGFDERLLRYEEKELFIRLLLTGKKVRKACLRDVLAYYRIHKDSIIRQRKSLPAEYYDTFVKVVKDYAPDFPCDLPSLSPMLSQCEWMNIRQVAALA